ncbi:hypothetical protein HYR69_00520 [Candidatus Sumerlaeota bacterium]|nr:hypothetical protein [Candidatus Sumerlaeota bacterium]
MGGIIIFNAGLSYDHRWTDLPAILVVDKDDSIVEISQSLTRMILRRPLAPGMQKDRPYLYVIDQSGSTVQPGMLGLICYRRQLNQAEGEGYYINISQQQLTEVIADAKKIGVVANLDGCTYIWEPFTFADDEHNPGRIPTQVEWDAMKRALDLDNRHGM